MMNIAAARWFAANRGAKRSSIMAPLWHIWLPTTSFKHLASSYSATIDAKKQCLRHKRGVKSVYLLDTD
jgi:hypothetical protein